MSSRSSPRVLIDRHDPLTVRLLPGEPAIDLSPQGVPMASLVMAGDSASLQISAHWWPDHDETDALLARAAEELEAAPGDLIVAIGGVQVHGVTLTAREDGGHETVLAHSPSSGAPPYTTILTAPVEPTLVPLVKDALSGSAGKLFVRFDATLETERVLRELDVGRALSAAPAAETHTFAVPEPAQTPEPEPTPPEAQLPLRVAAPVGDPPVHRLELSGTDAAGRPWTVSVTAPDTAPPRLPAGDSLRLTVQGDDGSSYARSGTPDASGWLVDDHALGVVTVTCEAPGRDQNATVALKVWYQPAGDGLPDHRDLTLTAPAWSASWRVASGRDDLDGELVIDVSETDGGGESLPKRTIRSTTPHIRI
ncbi:hypothetical protein [Streptomyces hilarionis]|uniref:hypothetical protein n=1 Tax=Streptomyces hilarionis TaxID=2839954 RepID=UPI002119C75C|nr:hypothetical protein [Streptomyces hilarionis]MCQ9135000.1 hypothetical protein [Streptomyces hilarionis]